MNINKIVVFGLLLVLTACRKDEEVTTVQFGNLKNMDTTSYKIGLNSGPGVYNDCIDLDLNSDGINDISFCSSLNGSLGSGYYNRAYVEVLNENLELSGYLDNDSTYLFHDTTYRESPVNPGEIMMSITKDYSCSKIDDNYKLLSIHEDKLCLSQYGEGDFLNTSDMFSMDEQISLLADKYSPPYTTHPAGVDTTAYVFYTPKGNCHYFVSGQYYYLGYKLIDGDQITRFGWVKLATYMYDDLIYIEETAILKQSN